MGRRGAVAEAIPTDGLMPSVPSRTRARLKAVKRPADIHLFICGGGEPLQRWTKAFPGAIAATPDEAATLSLPAAQVVWLRLAEGSSVTEQLAGVPAALRQHPLVVMSDLPQDEESLAAFGAGARGYCNTHAAAPVLQQVAGVVLQSGLWIGESLMQRLLRATSAVPVLQPVTAAFEWDAGLTGREREVARAVAGGASNKEVARSLGITDRTIKAHVGAVFEKLGVRDRLQLSLVVHGRAPRPKP